MLAYFVVYIHWAMISACFTTLRNGSLFAGHLEVGFRVIALRTQDVPANESVQQILQFIRVMRTIDDETLVLWTNKWKK